MSALFNDDWPARRCSAVDTACTGNCREGRACDCVRDVPLSAADQAAEDAALRDLQRRVRRRQTLAQVAWPLGAVVGAALALVLVMVAT